MMKKRVYVRPSVALVRLKPEEAVLGGCKYCTGLFGPDYTSCTKPGGVQCELFTGT